MKKILSYILIFLMSSFYIFGNDSPKKAEKIENFIPKNWKILFQENGDLNNDKIEDIVLIIENTDPKNIIKNEYSGAEFLNLNPRELLVLFKEKDGTYILAAKNDKGFIESGGNPEEPALEDPIEEGAIKIEKNLLKVKVHYFYSTGIYAVDDMEYIFRYQNNKFELIGIEVSYFMRNTGEMEQYSINFSTNKAKIITGRNIFKKNEDKPKIEWKNFKLEKKYLLDDMNSETLSGIIKKLFKKN